MSTVSGVVEAVAIVDAVVGRGVGVGIGSGGGGLVGGQSHSALLSR